MKATLRKKAVTFDQNISEYKYLPDEIECEVEVDKSGIHLTIPFEKKINKQALDTLFKTLDEPPVKCDINTLVNALDVDDH